MGCAASRIDREERVLICKERKRVMKQLLGFRAEFANAILAYLRALKNTGVTLRQFTESETLELEGVLPPSPPLPLPPSPPLPPPIDSPDGKKREGKQHVIEFQEEIIEIGEDSTSTPPPPPEPSWGIHNLLDTSSMQLEAEGIMVEDAEEDSWAETRSHFEEQDQEHVMSHERPNAPGNESLNANVVDDDQLTMSRQTKDMVNTALVVWRRKKALPAIVKELDDYFLKASAGAKEIAVLVDMGGKNASLHHHVRESKGKGNNSTGVLSSVSWGWSSRSVQLTKDEVTSPFEPCKSGAHCITLEKLYAEEQTLYKAVREEEIAKLEHDRKSSSLRRQENENADLNKIEKTQSAVNNLQSDIERLQLLVKRTCSSILTYVDEELHPQLVSLLSGLIHMWRTMSECHQFQSRICQQMHLLASNHNTESTTEYHREAAMQLESEVNFWHTSYCRLTKCQREYVNTLSRWIQLTECLVDDENQNRCSPVVRSLCEKWQIALDRLPEKVVAEAIKSFLLVIRAIIQQQDEEGRMKKKSDRLERRLHKEINSLIEIEKKLEDNISAGHSESAVGPKHPLFTKRAKADALRKQYENAKAKYVGSIQVSRAMTLHHLQTSLPLVFEALTGFSIACTEAFETALTHAQQVSNAVE